MVSKFFDAVRYAFSPVIPIRRVYIIPGNHDVDRGEITRGELQWLRDTSRNEKEIISNMEAVSKEWILWMQRFGNYRNFLRSYGLAHLSPEDPHLTWADVQDINGLRIGIAGFNSAWSASDDSDRGKLWTGIDFQIQKNLKTVKDTDINFALIHHPGGWFNPAEDPSGIRSLRNSFPIVLHGHEHQEWLESDQNGRMLISAGACYESSWMSNGYNFGHIDAKSKSGGIWLRQWDKAGGGWVERNISGRTKGGVWTLNGLDWIRDGTDSSDQKITNVPRLGSISQEANERYTELFCNHIIEQLDYLELFGCDIPRELQRHQLSVAYVSLNVSYAGDGVIDILPSSEAIDPENNEALIDSRKLEGNFSFESLISTPPASSTRLTILGPAGAGKSTLMRWCAIHAAQGVLESLTKSDREDEIIKPLVAIEEDCGGREGWHKVPFLIRLRDCKDGRLPAAKDMPPLLAKHLQSAPPDWVSSTLASGNAVILLDGVDEIHKNSREQMALEIEELVKTYPLCSYIVTTRQGAVTPGWLQRLNFTEATVEPMGRNDRDEFIDKWYRSAKLEIRSLKFGEDLEKTAAGLKQELSDQPELGLLASNPLICAMICALYRERQEKLPETPSELCEALVQMLLHRRERETPGMGDNHFLHEWRALLYPQKKSLIADLAWHMVSTGQSQIPIGEALPIIQKAMASTPGRNEAEAPDILRAVIERSGLLRPNGDDHISFLHNTLKEYLAASRAIEINDWEILVAHADDPGWQPVILFSLAIGSEIFNNNIVSKIFDKLPTEVKIDAKRKGARSKADQAKIAESNAKAFFLVRGKKAAKRLNAELASKIDKLTNKLLPPLYMQDVEALAQLGPKLLVQNGSIFENPRWWSSQDARTATRCLRLLRLIGGSRSKAYLAAIQRLVSGSSQLTAEWMLASCELSGGRLKWPFQEERYIFVDNTHVSDLTPLENLTEIVHFSAANTRVNDLNIFQKMRSLSSLDIRQTNISDLSPLKNHHLLTALSISNTRIGDLNGINSAVNLRSLRARNCNISDLSPISAMQGLRILALDGNPISNIEPISKLQKLELVSLKNTPIKDPYPLFNLKNLRVLELDGVNLKDITSIDCLSNLTSLSLRSTGLLNIDGITQAPKLQKLYLTNNKIKTLGVWSETSTIRQIEASHTLVTNVEGLRNCRNIQFLGLSHCPISNIEPLNTATEMMSLNLSSTMVRDYSAIKGMKKLRTLYISGSNLMDLSPLEGLDSLAYLSITGDEIDIDEIRRFLTKSPRISIHSTNFLHIPRPPQGP